MASFLCPTNRLSKCLVACFVSLLLGTLLAVLLIPEPLLRFVEHDPDEYRSTCEIIETRGFPCETHNVVTLQGYILELHRIRPFPFGEWYGRSKPVILQHGLTGTSTYFVMNSPDVRFSHNVLGQNMGLELAKRGYDVWLANTRGNRYGMKHINLQHNDSRFWGFTFDDMSQYDLPAVIDYVRSTTNQKSVAYIGHSQGTAMMFALLATPSGRKYNSIVQPFVAISPVTRLKKSNTSTRYVAKVMYHLSYQFNNNLDRPVFNTSVYISGFKSWLCHSPLRWFCTLALASMCGYNDQFNMSRLGVYVGHQSSTSMRNMVHYHQMFSSGKFAKFDYGPEENMAKYGQTYAPEYNLSDITHNSLHIIYSRNDLWIPLDAVQRLKKDLPKIKEIYEIKDPLATHCDPLIGNDVSLEVNHKTLEILKKYT